MKKSDTPHLARLAADICVLRRVDDEVQLLLIQRGKPPFEGYWALPGGRLEADETLDQCAARELLEETGLRPILLRHFANFSDPQRDPRERTVSAAYVARVEDGAKVVAGSDAAEAKWFSITSLPPLAFDHPMIVKTGLVALQRWPDCRDLYKCAGENA